MFLKMTGILAQLPDIEDIDLPEAMVSPWPKILLIGGSCIALILLTLLLVWALRKYLGRSQPPVPPHYIALRRFDELAATAHEKPPTQFSQAVSAVLEEYLEAQHHDRLRYETAQEFIERLSNAESSSVPMSTRQKLAEFVMISEEIKFGLPPDAEAQKLPLLSQAREIVAG